MKKNIFYGLLFLILSSNSWSQGHLNKKIGVSTSTVVFPNLNFYNKTNSRYMVEQNDLDYSVTIQPEPVAEFNQIIHLNRMVTEDNFSPKKKINLRLFNDDELKETTVGTHVGNGGDVAFCLGLNAPFVGIFTLDYLVSDIAKSNKFKLIVENDWQTANKRLLDVLSFDQELRAKYVAFLNSYVKGQSKNIYWKKWKSRLSHLSNDKMIPLNFPSNCSMVSQIVKRYEIKDEVHYYADIELLDSLKTYYPIQFSMILFHEFLWFMTKDLSKLRHINYLVHSNWADKYLKEHGDAGIQALFLSEFPTFREDLLNIQ